MILCTRWREFVGDVERDPFGPLSFQSTDRMCGWLTGYADFCDEHNDPDWANDIRWLVELAIHRAYIIRMDANKASTAALLRT